MKKKIIALALALTLALGGSTMVFAANSDSYKSAPAVTTTTNAASNVGTVTAGDTVTCYSDGTMAIKVTSATSTIYSSYTVGGVVYKVAAVTAKSVGKNVNTLTLNPGVTVIKKNAFAKAKNLDTLYIKCNTGARASEYAVQKKAFKGSYTEDATIIVSDNMKQKQFNKLKKKLVKGGFKGVIIQGDI